MRFDWTEFLHLAKELAGISLQNPPSNEAKYRSSISRAYYAAHCHGGNYLIDVKGKTIDHTPEAHQKVIDEFEKLGAKVIMKKTKDGVEEKIRISIHNQDYVDISDSLYYLRGYRNKMDYNDFLPGFKQGIEIKLSEKAKLPIKMVEDIFTTLKKYK